MSSPSKTTIERSGGAGASFKERANNVHSFTLREIVCSRVSIEEFHREGVQWRWDRDLRGVSLRLPAVSERGRAVQRAGGGLRA